MPSRATLQALKAAVFLLALAPLLLTGWDAVVAGLGVNPVESLLHRSGSWALRLLLLTLALTPLRRLTGANWLVRFRRLLGLYTFFYACLHFLVFVVFEHQLDPVAIWRDVVQRPFILAGVAALLLLLPLAITSTDNMMRQLGRRWRQLHRAVYASAVLVLLHVFLLNKSEDYREPLLYAVLLAILLLLRLRLG